MRVSTNRHPVPSFFQAEWTPLVLFRDRASPMQYETMDPISKEDAEKIFEGDDPKAICYALIRASMWLQDPDWVGAYAAKFLEHPDLWVRRNACTSLSYIPRFQGKIAPPNAIQLLENLLSDPNLKDDAEVSLWDLRMFDKQFRAKRKRRR